MEKEIIAIDTDDVLTETAPIFIEWVNKNYGTNLSYEEMHNQYIGLKEYLKIDQNEWQKMFDEFHESPEYKKIAPVRGAIKSIAKLKEKYELFIITARPEMLTFRTEKFIEKHFPKTFSGIHHTTLRKENISIKKSEICKKIGAKIIIEDTYSNAIECAEKGIKAIVLDRPWNRNKNYSHKNIIHAKNWEEIIKITCPKL